MPEGLRATDTRRVTRSQEESLDRKGPWGSCAETRRYAVDEVEGGGVPPPDWTR